MTEPLHTVRFPGESDDYRQAREELLEAEIDLRRRTEAVAAKRRALPPGGAVPEDYRFEEVADGGGGVRFSELFEAGRDTLCPGGSAIRAISRGWSGLLKTCLRK